MGIVTTKTLNIMLEDSSAVTNNNIMIRGRGGNYIHYDIDNDSIFSSKCYSLYYYKLGNYSLELTKEGKIANDKTVRYVLLKDIDVTYGDAAGAGVYRGTLDKKKIEKNTGVTISDDAMLALKGIIFMTDDDLDYFADVKAAPGA